VYCTAKVNSQGCTPAISSTGAASYSAPIPFTIEAGSILNGKSGLLFYGYAQAAVPFQGGTKCVLSPTRRTPVQSSGGSPTGSDCSGTFAYDMQARIQSRVDPALVPGGVAYAQFWSRDPQSPSTTSLTDGLCFTVCP
jgi:hypothetical protein